MRKRHVRRNCYGNMDTLTNNFVTSVFIKGYRRVIRKFKLNSCFWLSEKCSKLWYRIEIFEQKQMLSLILGNV